MGPKCSFTVDRFEDDRQRIMSDKLDETRRSWNVATRAHNSHKRDQAAFFKAGGSTLFPEELELLGDVRGQRLLHMQCNAGQDSLSLVTKTGARVTGVDMSDEAIAFARTLSTESGVDARFEESEACAYFERTGERFDVVFASYGALPWIEDLARYMRGVARVLDDGGRAVFLEFHPLAWSFTPEWKATHDPYFADGRAFVEAVNDYVASSGAALAPSGFVEGVKASEYMNPHKAHGYQHTVAHVLQCIIDAGLRIDVVREWPYSNGCKMNEGLVDIGNHRCAPPPGVSLPLMLGVCSTRAPE
jgi:SAM-dependent methyltransferase